jgi:cell shape-determining protein MreC
MNYLLKSKPKNEHKGKIVSIILVFCLLALAELMFSEEIRSVSYTIARPIWRVAEFTTKPFSGMKNFFVSKNNLINKNLALEEEMVSLRLKRVDYEILSKEFDELKNQLGRQGDQPRVLSRVLSKPPYSPYDNFVIDVGSEEGVSLGSRVYISDNIIIGLVKKITPHTSLVELFSNGDSEQETILSRTGSSFVLKGQGGGNLELEVPKDTDIIWGDVFLYPKFSTAMVGSVYYIDENSQNSFKKIYIRVPGNIFSTKYVFVERN